MRRIAIVLACIAMGFAAQAQEATAPKSVVKANPLGLLFGTANVAYERALNEKNSFVIAPTFGGFKFGGVKYSSLGLGAEYRFYLSKSQTIPEGFYAGPGASFTSGKVSFEDEENEKEKIKFSSFGVRAMAGHQWIFNSGFTIDLNGGLGWQKFGYKDNNESFQGLKANGVFPSLGFSLGYAF